MKKSRIFGAIAAAAMAVSAFAAMPVSAADSYHAYLGVQSQNFTFRNAWDEASYGKGVTGDDGMVYFDQLTGWDNNNAVSKGGNFTDVEITADGTYTVGVTDFDLDGEEYLNLLFVSTDIPVDAGVTISDVKVKMDGQTKYTFDEAFLSPDSLTYLQPMAINIWNDDLGKQDGLFGYVMPSTSIEMEFTVSGMGSAAAADDSAAADNTADVAPADTAPAADTTPTTSASTGNLPVAVMVSAVVVAGAAAVVSRKRK